MATDMEEITGSIPEENMGKQISPMTETSLFTSEGSHLGFD